MAHGESGLFEAVISDDVLTQAIERMTKGKRAKRKSSKIMLDDPQGCINLARAAALDKNWIPQPYYSRPYWDSTSQKMRTLSTVPALPTGLLQTAIAIVLEPLIIRRITPFCCGSIKGRGSHYAIKQVQRCLRNHKNSKHYVTLDIAKFYPTANSDYFLNTILPKISNDSRFNILMGKMIKKFGPCGFPIGSPFSHLVADLYICHAILYWLDTMDCRYVNYADDIFICSANKKYLRKTIVPGIMDRLDMLGHHLHDGRNTKQVTPDYGVQFLGRNIWEDHVTLRKSTLYKISAKARKCGLKPSPKQARSFMARLGLLKHTRSYNFRRAWVNPHICERTIRRIISEDSKRQAGRIQP